MGDCKDINSIHDVMADVFGQDMLRELILDFAIYYEKNEGPRQKNLQSLRIVSKCWRFTITKLLQKHKEPLYTLKTDSAETLTQFSNFFADRDETFALTLKEQFFKSRNYDGLIETLKTCGSGLVELTLHLPRFAGTLPGIIPPVCLPKLKTLTVILSSTFINDNDVHTPEDFTSPINLTNLLASLINQCPNVKNLSVTLDPDDRFVVKVPGLKFVTLPASLTKLTLECRLSNTDLELLETAHLPNLKELELELGYPRLSAEIIYNVCNNFSASLESLELKGSRYYPNTVVVTEATVKFPVMKKLYHLVLSLFRANLARETAENLATYFPELKTLELSDITEEAMLSWTQSNTKIDSITSLTLEMADYFPNQLDKVHETKVPTAQILHKFFMVMPNVNFLCLHVNGKANAKNLKPLFIEMKYISSLSISLAGTDGIENSDIWDCLLTGLPRKVVSGIRKSPEFWNNFNVDVTAGEETSIRNLKELQNLYLQDVSDKNGPPFISNLAFTCAFLKMPTLSKLVLTGRFTVSKPIARNWKKTGKQIQMFT